MKIEKKLKDKQEKEEAKRAKSELAEKITQKRPESELIKTEQHEIVEKVEKVEKIVEVEEKPQSARKLGNSLMDFFQKQPVGQQSSLEKVEKAVLIFSKGSIQKSSLKSKKVDSVQKVLFKDTDVKKEPKPRKRSKKSDDPSKNLAGTIKTICDKRVSSKKQKQDNLPITDEKVDQKS